MPDTASVFGNINLKPYDPNGKYFAISCRDLCINAIKILDDMGYSILGGFENEFSPFLINSETPLFNHCHECVTQTQQKCESFVKDTWKAMRKCDITPVKFHCEFPLDTLEMTCQPSFGIKLADDDFRFRQILKEVANIHKMHIPFMSKPLPGYNHNAGHFNHSIWSRDGKTNIFYDVSDKYKLSKLAKHWIAGIQHHSNALFGLLMATPNCLEDYSNDSLPYPHCNVWGIADRGNCFRVKTMSKSATYIENRFLRSCINPYLCAAGHIYAGMDGINRELEMQQEPFNGDFNLLNCHDNLPEGVSLLPTTLEEGLKCLESDDIFKREFGEDFMLCFVDLKRQEIKDYEAAKAKGEEWKWQKERYFSVF